MVVVPVQADVVSGGGPAGSMAAWAMESSMRRPSRADYYRQAFDRQYCQRLEVFRLVAFPEGIDLIEAELEAVTEGLGFFSEPEKKLALTTTMTTHCPNKICSVFERLNVQQSAVFTELPVEKIMPKADVSVAI